MSAPTDLRKPPAPGAPAEWTERLPCGCLVEWWWVSRYGYWECDRDDDCGELLRLVREERAAHKAFMEAYRAGAHADATGHLDRVQALRRAEAEHLGVPVEVL